MTPDPQLYKSKISVSQLDEMMNWLNKNPTNKLEVIFGLCQMLAVFAYIYVRSKLVDQEWEIQKQKYARDQITDNKQEILNDNKDGL